MNITLGKKPANLQTPVYTHFDDEPEICPICLKNFKKSSVAISNGKNANGNNGNTIFCGHLFHKECVIGWTSRWCPICGGLVPKIVKKRRRTTKKNNKSKRR